ITRIDDVDVLAIKSSSSILLVHTRDSVNSQSLLSRLANCATGDAIASAFESGSRDQEMGFATGHLTQQLFRGFFRMFGKVIADTKARPHVPTSPGKCLLRRGPGSDRPFFKSGAIVGFFSPADLCEELVQVMNAANFFGHEDLLRGSCNQPV